MNLGEYGVVYRQNVGFDISANTSLSITFTKPDGSTLVVTTGVSFGAVDVQTEYGTFTAHQYATYTFVSGDVDQVGDWSGRVTYNNTGLGQHLISTPGPFTVSP